MRVESKREGTTKKEGNRSIAKAKASLLSLKLARSIRPGKRTRPQNKGLRAYQGKFGSGSWVGANPLAASIKRHKTRFGRARKNTK